MLLPQHVGIVTGASSGIGRAIAIEAAREGAVVVGCARREAGLKETAALSQSAAGSVVPRVCDVSAEAQIENLIEHVLGTYGRIDFLVNNAGILSASGVVDVTSSEWLEIDSVNVRAPLLFSKHAARAMIASGRSGSIVNIGSTASLAGVGTQVTYCMSKHALLGLTRAMAADESLSSVGIRTNCVCPGEIFTRMVEDHLAASDDPVRARVELENTNPSRRLGTPDEVASVVVFLCSDRSRLINGAVVSGDLGQMARLS
jgi:NAD(P)-dependent dehydrogenase (short-subunit alcohol dehydrogenase family)